MPAKPGRDEQVFIRRFVSAYENFSWVGAKIDPLDEHSDGAPEALITRADGHTMAIEHTLIQPFLNEMADLARFEPAFRRIAEDKSLAAPYTGITVYLPVGILDGQERGMQELIAEAIHLWIANNKLSLRDGDLTLDPSGSEYDLDEGRGRTNDRSRLAEALSRDVSHESAHKAERAMPAIQEEIAQSPRSTRPNGMDIGVGV